MENLIIGLIKLSILGGFIASIILFPVFWVVLAIILIIGFKIIGWAIDFKRDKDRKKEREEIFKKAQEGLEKGLSLEKIKESLPSSGIISESFIFADWCGENYEKIRMLKSEKEKEELSEIIRKGLEKGLSLEEIEESLPPNLHKYFSDWCWANAEGVTVGGDFKGGDLKVYKGCGC